jgi:predicted Zn-dependent protease
MARPKTLLTPWPLRALALPVRWCLARRWRLRGALCIIFAAVAGASILLVTLRDRRTERAETIAELWHQAERASEREDIAQVEAALERIAELTDHDAAVEGRLNGLRRGEAEPGDAPLARLLMGEHLRHDRWPEATREAGKLVKAVPGHLLARGLLARRDLHDGRPDDARAHLAAIMSPFDNADNATPGALLLAAALKRDLGDDDSDLLAFMALRVAPILNSKQVDELSPVDAVQLLQCYHLACAAMDRYPNLAEYWVPGARLLARMKDDSARSATLATVREAHLGVLHQLQQTKALSERDSAALRGEFQEQVAAAWAAAHHRDERDPRPYVGLALASHRRGREDESREWLERGLRTCDKPRDLYLVLGRLLRASDPLGAAAHLEDAYDRFPADPEIQQLLAELALAVGRPDRAADICRAARVANPSAAWACRLLAAACLDAGRPTQALEALAPLRGALRHDVAGMELYTRAASAIGADTTFDELLTAEFKSPADAEGWLGAARGFLIAARPADAARCARTIIDYFPDHLPARAVHAEALGAIAEDGDAPNWLAERVRDALAAFEWLRRRDSDNRYLAQRIAWLQLKGLRAPALALGSAAPLRAEGAAVTPEMHETLAAVLLANERPDDALRYFDAAIERSPGRAGAFVGRAAALARLGRSDEAMADLQRAAALPRSPRQTAEWQRIDQQRRGEQ